MELLKYASNVLGPRAVIVEIRNIFWAVVQTPALEVYFSAGGKWQTMIKTNQKTMHYH